MNGPDQQSEGEAPEQGKAQLTADDPKIERYELLGILARGGMSAVYKARDRKTGELRALKCVRAGQHEHLTVLMEGLQREYQVLRSLSHPRIIQVFDYGLLTDGAYYTMELLEGQDMRTGGPFPWRETCQYMHDVATCLSLLHARRLIHRDLSAGNVKRTGDGHCKLIDFGALTSFGRTDTLIGTAPFIAPEVLEVGRLDQRVDLYALGALGYYCITGRHAYPASCIDDLPRTWQKLPPTPVSLVPDMPEAVSELIMDLLRDDPLARPSSAAEVIARLESSAELQNEDPSARRLVAQSFLAAPGFVGRKNELRVVERAIEGASEGVGSALRVVAPSGAGRTRMLDEIAVRAQLAGAAVLRADAQVARGRYGTVRVLCAALLDNAPEAAVDAARAHQSAIAVLEDPALELAAKVGPQRREPTSDRPLVARPSKPPTRDQWAVSTRRSLRVSSRPPHKPTSLEQWFVDVSRDRPVVVLIDNVDTADDASLGFLLGLARAALHQKILLVCTELPEQSQQVPFGMQALRVVCQDLPLSALTRDDMSELMHTVFGDAPRLERLVDWVHAETAGSPLHCLDLLRDLIARGEIRHERGAWVLPNRRPDTHASEQLEDALTRRLYRLSVPSRELVLCLCLHRLDPTLELCRALVEGQGEEGIVPLLDELAAADILYWHDGHFVFSSAALRQAAFRRLDARNKRRSHLRLGEALARLAGSDLSLQLEAGFHLIKGGQEMRGADMICAVTHNTFACNMLVANLHQIGTTVEAALKVYHKHRKSRRARMPMLTVLAQCGYYEHYRWSDTYGDDALDIVEDLSGFGTARSLRKYLGRHLALLVGMGVALVRHYATPRGVRKGSFMDLLVHVCSTITSLAGVAALSLDRERCERVADVLSPVSCLPERVALVGIYRFCQGLREIAREYQVEAFERFDNLARRLDEPGYYWFLPDDARTVYTAASHFARGAFAMMRADGEAALESADMLDATGLPLYQMIAAQIRRLMHLNRGELGMAELHRERVEVHAARAGSAWQVELWEPASLIPYYLVTGDTVELNRIAQRLARISEEVPSMWLYRELAELALLAQTLDPQAGGDRTAEELLGRLLEQVECEEPRGFIGWSTTLGEVAGALNRMGRHEEAMEFCRRALDTMTEADREYVMIFLVVDLQAAYAEAGLGRPSAAMERLDGLIIRHGPSMNALVLGLLHEARARIALAAERRADFADSMNEAVRWLRGTGTPSLVAIADRLAALALPPGRPSVEIVEDEITVVGKRPAAKEEPGS